MRITLITCLLAMARAQVKPSHLNCPELCKSGIDRHLWGKTCDCPLEETSDKAITTVEGPAADGGNLDDTGIYYEPTDLYLRRFSFVNPPFYIINPTIKLKIEAKDPKFVFKRKILHHDDSKPKSEVFKDNEENDEINKESKSIYLDIDTSAEDMKSAPTQANEAHQLTEEKISECINVHLLAYSKTKTSQNDKEDDLLTQIKEKCNQPAKIVQKSLEEIKNRWPNLQNYSNEKDFSEIKINSSSLNGKDRITLNKFFESAESTFESEDVSTENSLVADSEDINDVNIKIEQIYNNDETTAINFEKESYVSTQYEPGFTTENTLTTVADDTTDTMEFETAPEFHLKGIMLTHDKNDMTNHKNNSSLVKSHLSSNEDSSGGKNHNILFLHTNDSSLNDVIILNKEHNNNLIKVILQNKHRNKLGAETENEQAIDENQMSQTSDNRVEASNQSFNQIQKIHIENEHYTTETQSASTEHLYSTNPSIIELSATPVTPRENFLLNDKVTNTNFNDSNLRSVNQKKEKNVLENKPVQVKILIESHEKAEGTRNINMSNANITTNSDKTISTRSTIATDYILYKKESNNEKTKESEEIIIPASTNENHVIDIGRTENKKKLQLINSFTEPEIIDHNILSNNSSQEDLSELDSEIVTDDDLITALDTTEIRANNKSQHQNDSEVRNAPNLDIVSKIVTREFDNDTVISNVIGMESTQNEDGTADVTKSIRNGKINAATKTETLDSKELISGKLLFFFDKVTVPARFIQDKDGELSIGIDGATMCAKLNPKNKKSLLIETLCNGIFDKNCTHNSAEQVN